MIRRPPRSTLFPTRRSSDLERDRPRSDEPTAEDEDQAEQRQDHEVARRHVREQPQGERERLDELADDLDRRHDRSRSEEHTSELQSQSNIVCRLLLDKKNKK